MYKEYLVEPFLAQYYLLEAICDDFTTEKQKKKMFNDLASVFCLKDFEDLDYLYSQSNLEWFKEIKNISSYERLCRTIEFAQISGQKIQLDVWDRIIMAQKREAMQIKSELFKQVENLTEEKVSNTLLTTAMNGNINAISTLAFMEYHGIGVCKDTNSAVKRMRICARWNSVFGNLLGLAYDAENSETYFNTLYSVLRNASQRRVFDRICNTYGYRGEFETNSVSRIIEKAFGMDIIKRNVYDSIFAKVAFSGLISTEDKEILLLNKQGNALSYLSDIPFDVDVKEKLDFDESCAKNFPLNREAEITTVLRNLAIMERCSPEVYAPLLVVASDEYVSDAYKTMLKKGFAKEAVVEIDASTLTARDFRSGRENVFLRSLSESKTTRTVFIVQNCDELDEESVEEFAKLLDYNYRKKFRLCQPPISLDLSGMTFVLFAEKRTRAVKELEEFCDILLAANTTAKEKNAMVDSLFRSRAKSYGCDHATLESGCVEYLAGYDSKRVQHIIDKAFRSAIYEETQDISLTTIKALCETEKKVAIKRDFGYLGGSGNAED